MCKVQNTAGLCFISLSIFFFFGIKNKIAQALVAARMESLEEEKGGNGEPREIQQPRGRAGEARSLSSGLLSKSHVILCRPYLGGPNPGRAAGS